GAVASSRNWDQMRTSMPFSVYIPVDRPGATPATVAQSLEGQLRSIQGYGIDDEGFGLAVSIQGKILALNVGLDTTRRYSLPKDVQDGRAVSIDPPPGYAGRQDDQRKWIGWDRFDQAQV